MERFPCGPDKNSEDCPVFAKIGQCYEDIDHRYYPRPDYKTKLEKKFRELTENKQRICRASHNLRHLIEDPPEKPSIEHMKERMLLSTLAKKAIGRALDGQE